MVVALSRYAYPPEGETIAATVWYVDYQETRKKKGELLPNNYFAGNAPSH